MTTRAYLQHIDGRWAEAVIEDAAMPLDMQPWAARACTAYGLGADSLRAVIVQDDGPDPRTGDLLREPVVELPPQPVAGPTLAERLTAVETILATVAPDAVAASPVLAMDKAQPK